MPDINAKLDALGERWAWFGAVLRVHRRYGELEGNYMASAITLAAFLSLFPLLLVAIAVLGYFASNSASLAGDIVENLGVTGDAERAVTDAIAVAQRSRKTASVIGLAGLLWSGLGLIAALQYGFNRVWQVKGRGMKDKLYGLAWLAGAAVLLAGAFALTACLRIIPSWLAPLGLLLGVAVNTCLWLWTMHTLTNRDVGWRALVPGAVVGGIGLEVLKAVGSIYVPKAVGSASALYGSLGVVFATLAWLLFFGRLVVYSAVVNVVQWEQHHGTIVAELEVPRVPGEEPGGIDRAGDALPSSGDAGSPSGNAVPSSGNAVPAGHGQA